MSPTGTQSKRVTSKRYFIFKNESDAFSQAFTQFLTDSFGLMVSQHINHENIQKYSHGIGSYHPAKPEAGETRMQKHTTEMVTKLEDIVGQKLSILPGTLRSVLEEMKQGFFGMLYSKVSESCQAVGNTVSAKEVGSDAQAFLAMLKKIEFGVGRDGKVSVPEIHASPDVAEKMLRELEAQPKEFKQEVAEIQKTKAKEALERENVRRKRFKGWTE